jgi:hypothetical protein
MNFALLRPWFSGLWHYVVLWEDTLLESILPPSSGRFHYTGMLQGRWLWDPRRWGKERNPVWASCKKLTKNSLYKGHASLSSQVGNWIVRSNGLLQGSSVAFMRKVELREMARTALFRATMKFCPLHFSSESNFVSLERSGLSHYFISHLWQ